MEKTTAVNSKTVAIMISVGDRTHLSNITFKRLADWAARHGYDHKLIQQNYSTLDKPPHFNKLVAHKIVPGYERYIIVDDDLVLRINAPAVPDVPRGHVGLCKDAVQTNTEAPHVKWTGNTGFIIADKLGLPLLEEAYNDGVYSYNAGDGSGLGIWGPYDQAALNNVIFKHDKAFELDQRWNYQPVIDFYAKGKGWDTWRSSKFYRVSFYLSLIWPFSKIRRILNEAYGIHMIMGVYPKFFSFIHR